ncbi:glycosyltransferase family 2 protein [Rhodocaloribacter litoris]|uniref:glycosyltransferase family 2 protein n=1 Tax=Rhodocaloribacter litoris TaxID=2558931 RepID=UPI001420135C|nr:glycosyltransferase family A protein [Rhodocaloribacter litoris]QXD14343.1 glycosyltransferase family 2 protein [Rhodocaloribacter litoris]
MKHHTDLQPLVSAIMPAYNEQAHIGDAIRSILSQTLQNWELIIVNDGSTDNTERIVLSFDDARIKYVYQENKGRGAARNKALSLAKGKYVAVTDADDISLPERFETEVRFLEEHPEIAVVSGQLMVFGDSYTPRLLYRYPTDLEEIRAYFGRGVMGVPHPASMIRRSVFDEIGGYCEECLRAQDLELFLRINQRYTLACLDECMIHYRALPSEMTASFWFRLMKYQEYAYYRSRCIALGREPDSFTMWEHGHLNRLRFYVWHGLRYVKYKIRFFIK